MKPVFLINHSVLFEPEKRRLYLLANYPERAVVLHAPVSECLLQLLEHNGQVMSQRDLFAAVWEKQGAVVTTNALYQTIASIRKALKTVGLAENMVQTVPKEGFKSVAHIETGTLDDFITPAALEPVETFPDTGSEFSPSVNHGVLFFAVKSPGLWWGYYLLFLVWRSFMKLTPGALGWKNIFPLAKLTAVMSIRPGMIRIKASVFTQAWTNVIPFSVVPGTLL